MYALPHRAWRYPTIAQSAGAARRDVAAQLERWGMDDFTETATVVTSELVGNAVAASQQTDDEAAAVVALRLTYGNRHVIIEVWDQGPGLPTRPATDPGPDAEDGRGLHLVTTLAQRTGYYDARVRTPDGRFQPKGKIVWAALAHDTPPRPRGPHPTTGGLEHRVRFPVAATDPRAAPEVFDLALLHRVLDALRNLDTAPPAAAVGAGHHATAARLDRKAAL